MAMGKELAGTRHEGCHPTDSDAGRPADGLQGFRHGPSVKGTCPRVLAASWTAENASGEHPGGPVAGLPHGGSPRGRGRVDPGRSWRACRWPLRPCWRLCGPRRVLRRFLPWGSWGVLGAVLVALRPLTGGPSIRARLFSSSRPSAPTWQAGGRRAGVAGRRQGENGPVLARA